MSPTHKALLLEKKFGGYAVGDIATPKPGAGELLVKVHAAALNPVDWKIQKYGIFIETFPAILGSDVAGEVAEVGEGVSGFKVGDRVVFQGQYSNNKAGFQQYSVVLADITAKIPSNLSYDEASTVPVAVSTAWIGLYHALPNGFGLDAPISAAVKGKYKDTPLVVLGGATSVGQVVLQLAKYSGFSPIITTASLKNADSLRAFGATHVFDRSLSDSALVSEVAKVVNGKTVKFVYDTVSEKSTQETALALLHDGGHLALLLQAAVEAPKNTVIIQVFGGYKPDTASLLSTLYRDNLHALLEQEVVKPNQVEVLPNGLAGIPAGLKRLEDGQISRSKLVAHPLD
ncbi:hypothetical protein HYPSUDRAFT_43891 [Hypholoma sublateritium FD-334 SS-4]|uniref:Enoyl reductase (ER) domain-containing protein n=1 Tax=Hypholoma sublateritium (strain FD-334 SS-4) TaxID=945553 RepID=A0A0D2M8Z3_HYPSF|nr:hypothetical protein HYPSUDRAFT_43891 [Hypholoma sublateritium FD-334 SS-4]